MGRNRGWAPAIQQTVHTSGSLPGAASVQCSSFKPAMSDRDRDSRALPEPSGPAPSSGSSAGKRSRVQARYGGFPAPARPAPANEQRLPFMDAILAGRENGADGGDEDAAADPDRDDALAEALEEEGSPFPDAASLGDEIGADVGHARLVTGPRAAAAAEAVDASAFTIGDRVFMGAGEDPHDRDLARHELTHVAQQKDAEMPSELAALPVTSPDHAREREAEHASESITRGPMEIARRPRGVKSRAAQDMTARVARLEKKSDEELQQLKAELTARLAGSLGKKARVDASHERDAIEWVEYKRQVERGESGRSQTYSQELASAQDAGNQQGVSAQEIGARARIESAYRTGGVGEATTTTWHLGSRGTQEQRQAIWGQGAAISGEAEVFRTEFREQARHTALGMLDDSSVQIEAALSKYGFVGGNHRLFNAADAYNRDPDQLEKLVSEWRVLSDVGERAAETKKGDKQQAKLAKVVAELRAMQREADKLEAEERGLTEQDWAMRDSIDSSRSSAGMKAKLADAWLAAEEEHPILLAFRDPTYGADADRLGGLTAPGAGLEESILRQAIPKLGNILRTRAAIRTQQLDPLRMGPVVEVTKQHLSVPPGSARASIANDLHVQASKQSVADWALSALSIALSVASFVPGVGLGARAVAEGVSLAIELRAQVNEYKEWRVAGGMNNTALDIAKSVSLSAPNMRPLYLRLAVAGASAASLLQLARLTSKLNQIRTAEGKAEDVLRELDELGARHGIKDLSDEVEAAGAIRGAKVYPPKTFVKDDVTRFSQLNAEKVRDGLKRARGRTYVAGARLDIETSKATVEGGQGVLRIPGAQGDTLVSIEIRFRTDLSMPGPHGFESGPARFVLDKSAGGWAAKIDVASSIEPRDIEFVLGHELDEIAELTRRFPRGKPARGFGSEVKAGVMRAGATTNQSTAHDIATAREIVALHKSHKAMVKEGSQHAAERARSLDEAIKAAGLDELTELDAKLRLLQQEGATEDLLDRVRRVGSRHVTQEHAKTMGKTGTRFTEDLIDHVMWGRGQSNQEFARLGAKGGHITNNLLGMGHPNSEYVFVELRTKEVSGTTARLYKQYKWTGPRSAMPQPGSGRFPSDKGFNDSGWITTMMPKTSFDDGAALLREAEEAWDDWLEGVALAPTRTLKVNEWTARTRSGVQISGFFKKEAGGTSTPTTFFVEASWF
ncbi:MAG: DUF4157 domain-containing protein [Kofleriaceae bacterium]|nr:MAG: DUF4157 domain-containing protein [Kofleriaceae bacterium]